MIIPKGRWVTNQDGWIQTETGETITEYGECGSHASEFATDGVKALILAAPEMLAVIQELTALGANKADTVCFWQTSTLWGRIAELSKRLEHTHPGPEVKKEWWSDAPLDATHWGPETNDYYTGWYKQAPNGEWSCCARQSRSAFGAGWYGLGNTLKPGRISQLVPRDDWKLL